jgi:hypothetical protein
MEGDLIHIKAHHGGSFSTEGPLTYDGGYFHLFDQLKCSVFLLSLFYLPRIVELISLMNSVVFLAIAAIPFYYPDLYVY